MAENALRIPVHIKGKTCYIDGHGSMVLETPFLRGGWFFEDRAPVWDGQHYGFIDLSGNLVVATKFDNIKRFSEGHCAASIGDKWGLIDFVGNWVVEPEFADVGQCAHGLIGVSRRQGYDLSYTDLKGKVVVESVGLKGMSAFSEGLIAAGDDASGLYGFRNTSGEWAIKPKYSATGEFSEGVAAVDLVVGKSELTGYIDTAGNEVLPCKFMTTLAPFQCGVAVACDLRKRKRFNGAIDKSGNWVIEPAYYYLQGFYEELSMFRKEPNSKIGFLDTNGNVRIEESFTSVEIPFRQGIASVQDDNGRLYINRDGECVWRLEQS